MMLQLITHIALRVGFYGAGYMIYNGLTRLFEVDEFDNEAIAWNGHIEDVLTRPDPSEYDVLVGLRVQFKEEVQGAARVFPESLAGFDNILSTEIAPGHAGVISRYIRDQVKLRLVGLSDTPTTARIIVSRTMAECSKLKLNAAHTSMIVRTVKMTWNRLSNSEIATHRAQITRARVMEDARRRGYKVGWIALMGIPVPVPRRLNPSAIGFD